MAVSTRQHLARLKPLSLAAAAMMHMGVMAILPSNVQGMRPLSPRPPRPPSLVEVTTFEVPPEPPTPVAERPRPIERRPPTEHVPEPAVPPPVAENTPEPPPVTSAAPVTEAAPHAPAVMTAPEGSAGAAGFSVPAGSESGSGPIVAVASNGNTAGAAPAQIDLRALSRSYRNSARGAIAIPRLRGVREPVTATVLVGMHVSSDGRLSDIRVKETSGHPIIDAHVLDYFRSLSRLPPPPPELGLERREFTYLVSVRS